MNAVAKMRQAGFLPALSPAGGLLIEPASKLTPEQRALYPRPQGAAVGGTAGGNAPRCRNRHRWQW
jgi:hypothetical protein